MDCIHGKRTYNLTSLETISGEKKVHCSHLVAYEDSKFDQKVQIHLRDHFFWGALPRNKPISKNEQQTIGPYFRINDAKSDIELYQEALDLKNKANKTFQEKVFDNAEKQYIDASKLLENIKIETKET